LSTDVETIADLVYARLDDRVSLYLDIHRPKGGRDVPAIVYFHGGGWRRGSRKDLLQERLRPLAAQGIAVASVSYRFVDEATFPAQLHDAKAAVRWLRSNGGDHGLRTDRIGAFGASAGGWIALMLGLTAGDRKLEGEIGDHTRADSSVQAIAAWFPTTNLATTATERESAALPLPPFIQGPVPPLEAGLLGLSAVTDDLAAAQAASPISHVANASGPVLLVHGDQDGLINIAQSIDLHDALIAAGKMSQLMVLRGANHEDPQFQRPAVIGAVAGFFSAL
jgi:acetyl esterase/lipase